MGIFDSLFKKAKPSATAEQEPLVLQAGGSIRLPFPTIEMGQLTGKCLIASPFMDDRRFKHAVVFLCGHSDTGAMGLVINNALDEPDFPDLLKQFSIDLEDESADVTIVAGGPVESMRGFVLHSRDYHDTGTQSIGDDLALSASLDVLRAMAKGEGPEHSILALGYTGWDAGQLERELSEHMWFVTDSDHDLLFEISCNHRWEAALGRLGVQPASISHLSGRA